MTNKPFDVESPFGEDLWVVLGRYASGESTQAEAERVRAWLGEDPRRGDLLTSLDHATRLLAYPRPVALESERQWRRLEARLDEPAVVPLPVRAPVRWYGRGLRAAAVVALVAGATALWVARNHDQESRPVVTAAAMPSYRTAVGQTDSVRLPDGTQVILGPDSRLTLAARYGTGRREIQLSGEAFFDVPHDAAHPFTVRAGSAVIEDLGTAFSVREDGGDVRVVVESGSVRLRDTTATRSVDLKAGDRGALGPSAATVERAAATAEDLAWTHGRLVFSGAPMPLVVGDLRRWYGIDLRIADSALATRHLTASFQHETAAQALDMVALALGAIVERRGDTAIVRAK